MKIRENCYMLGLGSTGGKIYKEFVQRHYKGAAANGSEQDHKALGDVPNKYILQGFDGFEAVLLDQAVRQLLQKCSWKKKTKRVIR